MRVPEAERWLHRNPGGPKPLSPTELLLATSHGAVGLAAARAAAETSEAGEGAFAVVGLGPTGLLALSSLHAELAALSARHGGAAAPAALVGVDPVAARRQLARSSFAASHVRAGKNPNPNQRTAARRRGPVTNL